MSVLTVAKKDFKGARRSKSVWLVAIVLGAIAALLAHASSGFGKSDLRVVQEVFGRLGLVLAFLLPIVALVASYLAIAGERQSGGIKFLLALPNSRLDVFLGKLLSRLLVVTGAVALMFLTAVSVALTRHGAFPAGVVGGMFVLTAVYGAVFVGVAVAFSAAVRTRAHAIAASLAAYFGLVLLYVFPVISITQIAAAVHQELLGMESNPDLYNAIRYTSPYLAYQKATNLVVPTELEQRPFRSSIDGLEETERYREALANPDLPVYLSDEVSLVILAVWLVVPLVAGYWLFERADLE
jgi:ABC-2 type transport system permease protein